MAPNVPPIVTTRADCTHAEKATLAGVLGRVGEEGGMTAGVAKLLFDKRDEIERVFAEHDRMVAQADTAFGKSGDVISIKDLK